MQVNYMKLLLMVVDTRVLREFKWRDVKNFMLRPVKVKIKNETDYKLTMRPTYHFMTE